MSDSENQAGQLVSNNDGYPHYVAGRCAAGGQSC